LKFAAFLERGMNSKILCDWLGTKDWPPDHHALLGLAPGEKDAARIEHQVHERMSKLRCYQLSHPEEATEGMNRLAQAFICVTEELSRAQRQVRPTNGAALHETHYPAEDTQEIHLPQQKTDADWREAPPPVRALTDSGSHAAIRAAAPSPPAEGRAPVAKAAGAPPARPAADPITELAWESAEARRGLGTLPALIERVHQTRQLILAWNQAGKYLGNPQKKLSRSAEEGDLTRRLNRLFELTWDFPRILGQPGQPGYRVVAMARLEMTAQMFKMLDGSQRAAMARDWKAGYEVLRAYRRFLLAHFRFLRSRGFVSRLLQAVRSALNDHPVWVVSGVSLAVFLCVVVCRKLFF
jgi:hypothetical protein